MKVKKSKGKVRLCLEGDMTVNNASEFRKILVSALQQGDSIEVDFTDVTEVDLTCLQLLCSAHRTAANSNKELTIISPGQLSLLDARKRAGFAFHKSCRFVPSDDCLWIGGPGK